MDIGTWLRALDVERYEQAFRDNDVDAAVLPNLTADDLIGLGVASIGHRRKMLAAIACLHATESTPTPPPGERPDIAGPDLARRSDAERRQLTVMFCDLVGSTALSGKLDPEDLGGLIRAYQGQCAKVVERWGGHLAKYMGDGVLAYFGWPTAHEDDPERAVRAGLELVESVADQTTPDGNALAVRVGIATGLVMVGDLIGAGASLEQTVVGETPNLAARLQGLAESGTVVVADDTRRLLRGAFQLDNIGAHTLKGFDAPVTAWRVSGEAAAESRFEAQVQEPTLLVGRDDEVEILDRRWQRARGGEGQVVLIVGEAGIGKSRLAATLREHMADARHVRLTYQCSPHHAETAFHPVIRQLEHAASIRPEQDRAERLGRLKALLRSSGDAAEEPVRLLASLLSIPLEPVAKLDGHELKERTLRTLLMQVERLASSGPVLMLLEDLHWADLSTLELLDRLVERVEPLPVLVLLTARPGFVAPWTDQAHVTLLTLNRIGRRESRTLSEALVGEGSISDDLIEEITIRSDGIPLFIEELTRTVLETRRADGQLATGSGPPGVPASLQDSLMARLDRLGTGKPVAQVAAAIGRDFTPEMLEPICGLPRGELDRAFDELASAGVLIRRGTSHASYVFKHALVQDAAYNSLLLGSRRQLHQRIAEALGERLAEEPALLAHHWEGAQDFSQALKYRLVAGDRALARSAMQDANAQYWRAVELLRKLPDSEDTRRQHLATILALVRSIGEFWQNDADRARALSHIDRAIEIATNSNDAAALARLKAFKAERWGFEPLFTEAVRHAIDAGDQRVRADVERYAGGLYGMLGRFEESIGHIERTIEMYAELGAEIDQGLAMGGAGRCYSARAGRLEQSFQYAERARAIATATGNLRLRSRLAMEAEPCLYKGLWQRAVDVVDHELPVAWELGDWPTILWCSGWAAISEVKLGRSRSARARIDAAFKKAGPRCANPFVKSYPLIALGQVHLAEGELQAALDAGRKAAEMGVRAEARLEQGAAHRLLGQIQEARGDRAAAEADHRESLEILGAIQSRPELAQSLLAYGCFKRPDDADAACRLLEDALAIFEDINATGWIQETRVALKA